MHDPEEITGRDVDVESASAEDHEALEARHSEEESPDLETVMHLMWDRLEKLELEKRRLKRAATIVLAGLVVVIAVLAADLRSQSRPIAPSSGPMILRDAAGNVRAKLEADPATGATILQFLGSDGRPQAKLASDDSGSGLTFYDKEGDPRLRMGVVSESPTLDLIDKAGAKQTRVDLASGEKYSRHLASDEPVEPAEPVRNWRRSKVEARSEVPARARNVTCWPGTLGCSGGSLSRGGDASGPG